MPSYGSIFFLLLLLLNITIRIGANRPHGLSLIKTNTSKIQMIANYLTSVARLQIRLSCNDHIVPVSKWNTHLAQTFVRFIQFIQYFKRVSLLAKLASLPSGPL